MGYRLIVKDDAVSKYDEVEYFDLIEHKGIVLGVHYMRRGTEYYLYTEEGRFIRYFEPKNSFNKVRKTGVHYGGLIQAVEAWAGYTKEEHAERMKKIRERYEHT